MHGIRGREPSRLQRLRHALEHALEPRIAGREVAGKIDLMMLGPARQHRSHDRNTHAPTNVSRQVHQA